MDPFTEARDLIREHFPQVWAALNPRRVLVAQNYHPPEGPALQLAMATVAPLFASQPGFDLLRQTDSFTPLFGVLAAELMRYGMPAFWLGADLATALLRSSPPPKMTFGELPMPFPAWILHLPKGALIDPEGTSVAYLLSGILPKGRHQFPFTGTPVHCPHDSFIGIAGGTHPEAALWRWRFHLEEPLNTPSPTFSYDFIPDASTDQRDNDTAFIERLRDFSAVVNLVLSDPEFRTSQLGPNVPTGPMDACGLHTERPEKYKNGKLLKEALYRPHILGSTYLLRTATPSSKPDSPSGITRAPHWVRGHVRLQAHGPSRALRKPKWIEPYQTH